MKLTDIKLYLSGAASHDATIPTDSNLSLGGFKTTNEIFNKKTATPSGSPIAGVTVNFASVANSNAAGTLTFTLSTNSLQWTPPGGSIGAAVAFTANGTKIIYGSDASMFIEVTVVYASLPGANDTDTITISENASTKNNIFDNVSSAEASSGDTEYRAIYVKNTHATEALQGAKVFIQANTPSTNDVWDFAVEDPSSRTNGSIQTIANENTAPTGLTWYQVSTKATAIAIAGAVDLSAGTFTAIWFRRTVSASASNYANNSCNIRIVGDTATLEN